jgi:hypothetical protein
MNPLTQEWREEHVRKADVVMDTVHKMMAEFDAGWEAEDPNEVAATVAMVQLLVSVAQAHYQAANVRAKLLT